MAVGAGFDSAASSCASADSKRHIKNPQASPIPCVQFLPSFPGLVFPTRVKKKKRRVTLSVPEHVGSSAVLVTPRVPATTPSRV